MGAATGAPPRVTVVMSTNRVSPYLAEALASVVAQTYTDWHVLLMDNGSPDPDRLAEIAAGVPGCELVREKGHVVSIPLNHGVALARGEYVTFLDDDDVWLPERLQVLVDALDADPTAGAVYSSVDVIDSDGRRRGPLFVVDGETERDLLAGRYPFPNVVSVLYRRTELVRVGGFNPAFRYAEDTDLTFRMLQYSRMIGVPQVLTLYRRHEQNVTKVAPTVVHDAARRMIRMQLWGAENHPDPRVLGDVRANLAALDAQDATDSVGEGFARLLEGHPVGAARMLVRAARLDPRAAAREAWRRAQNRLARRG